MDEISMVLLVVIFILFLKEIKPFMCNKSIENFAGNWDWHCVDNCGINCKAINEFSGNHNCSNDCVGTC